MYTLIPLLLVGMIYGGWMFSRHWNYKWGYQSMVQMEIQKQYVPLSNRVAALEFEIKELKKN